MIHTVITGSGSHIPERVIPNDDFLGHDFRGADQKTLDKPNAEILRQFESITGIRERRYAPDAMVTTDLGGRRPASAAILGIDGDRSRIIVAHNLAKSAPQKPRGSRPSRRSRKRSRHPHPSRAAGPRLAVQDGCRAFLADSMSGRATRNALWSAARPALRSPSS